MPCHNDSPPHTSFYGYDSAFTQPRALPAPNARPPLALANVLAPPAGLPFSVSQQAGPGDSCSGNSGRGGGGTCRQRYVIITAKSSKRVTRAGEAPSVQAQPLLLLTWLVRMTVTLMSPCILRRQGNTQRGEGTNWKSHGHQVGRVSPED